MPVKLPIGYGEFFYNKSEVDDFFEEVYQIKADKAVPSMANNICGLVGSDGNILDLGAQLSDFIIEIADGGTF